MRSARLSTFPALVLLLAICPASLAEDDDDLIFGEDVLSAEEIAARELERSRNAPPALACSPARLRASLTRGKSKTLRLTIVNSGGRTLEWSITQAPDWVRPSERRGSLRFEEGRTVEITLDSSALEPGQARADVVIDAAGAEGSPFTVPVALWVREPRRPGNAVDPTGPRAEEPTRDRRRDRTSSRRREERPRKPRVADRDERDETGPPRRSGPSRGADGAARQGRFGVRAGMLLPSAGGSADYDSSLLLGFYYRPMGLNGAGLGYELGAQVGAASEAGGYESVPVTGSVSLLFPLGKGKGRTKAYLLSGLGGMVESVTEQTSGDRYTNYAGTLDLGGGVGLAGGRLDLRLTWCFLLWSQNLVGHGVVAAGYSF